MVRTSQVQSVTGLRKPIYVQVRIESAHAHREATTLTDPFPEHKHPNLKPPSHATDHKCMPAQPQESLSEARLITLRFPGNCRDCESALQKGTKAYHVKSERKVVCVDCAAPTAKPATQTAAVARLDSPSLEHQPTAPQPLPGQSAQREYDRRRGRYKAELDRKWGRAGSVVSLLRPEPWSARAWGVGAKGERAAGEHLEKKLRGFTCEALHDRRIPGSRANIDHIVIGPAGVTVFDTKNMRGKVRAKTVGIGRRRRTVLMVDNRDQTKLIDGVRAQVTVVEQSLLKLSPKIAVPVAGGILWWKYDGLPLLSRVKVGDIGVYGPNTCWRFAGREGPLTPDDIGQVADFLDITFVPA